jgi:hypothetical protein
MESTRTPVRAGRPHSRSPHRNVLHPARFLLPGLLILVAAGCGTLAGERDSTWTVADTRDESFSIEVRNDNFNQARIFARWNGDRRRLGEVGGNQSRTFNLDWRTQDLRLEVDFLAGGGFVSDRISVNPGDRLYFRIPASAR